MLKAYSSDTPHSIKHQNKDPKEQNGKYISVGTLF